MAEINYSFADERPMAGRNYYRLRQVDFDGASSYSKIVSVDQRGPVRELVAYPNPVVGGSFTVSLSGFKPQEVTMLRLADLRGRVVAILDIATDASGSAELDIQRPLSAGLYLLTVFSSDSPRHVKLVVR